MTLILHRNHSLISLNCVFQFYFYGKINEIIILLPIVLHMWVIVLSLAFGMASSVSVFFLEIHNRAQSIRITIYCKLPLFASQYVINILSLFCPYVLIFNDYLGFSLMDQYHFIYNLLILRWLPIFLLL